MVQTEMRRITWARLQLCTSSHLGIEYVFIDRLLFNLFQCHYSISKAAALLGIGTKNVYVVPSDKR